MPIKKAPVPSESEVSILIRDEISPLFWQAQLLDSPSAWFGHIPFAHWLVRNLKPRVVVELGTHAGVSYSAFCAAVHREEIGARCFAVDTWKGDSHAGHYPEEVYKKLNEFNANHYGSFSTLLRRTFDDAVELFEDKSIDLLHIDGFHSYEAVSHDYNTWKKKLSDRAVVLFHDTNEYQEGFGVHRFWAEIRRDHPNFEFLHSHGLGVLCFGTSVPRALIELSEFNQEQTNRLRLRFQLLGERWSVDAKLRRQISDHVAEIERIQKAHQSKISDIKADHDTAIKEKIEKREAGFSVEVERLEKAHKATIADLTAANAQRDANAAVLEESRQSLTSEITALRRTKEQLLAENQKLLAGAVQSNLERKQLEAINQALLTSTSWQLTAPLRLLTTIFRKLAGIPIKKTSRFLRLRKQRRVLSKSSLFNRDWYLENYPDVREAGLDPIKHYLSSGAAEGRNPSSQFDTKYYRTSNQDVANAKINPLYHYLRHGQQESRNATRPLSTNSTPQAAKITSSRTSAIPRLDPHIEQTRRYAQWNDELEAEFLGWSEKSYQEKRTVYDDRLVSIVMPTFNREKVIDNAIRSVLDQSHTNWKLIIIDDGSSDDTKSAVAPFLSDVRIKYVYQENEGVSAARNKGLDLVEGDYVFFLDSDNTWNTGHIRNLLIFMVENHLDAAYSALVCVDDDNNIKFYRGTNFNWHSCHHQNYIDLNCFAHRSDLIESYRFDTNLKRLVDWDYLLRITKLHRTAYAPFIGVRYYDGESGERITLSHYNSGELPAVMKRIRRQHTITEQHLDTILLLHPGPDQLAHVRSPHISASPLRIGYVVWDWPALSQTFVINEVRWLIENNYDVKVYYKILPDRACELDFKVDTYLVQNETDLAALVSEHDRTVLHSPFATPAATLLTWPTATKLKIPFTFMPGGVDISHYENRKRNRVAEMASSEFCAGVITLGSFHGGFLQEQGVPSSKIVMERQAVALPDRSFGQWDPTGPLKIVAIGRFVEKKGFRYLVEAAPKLAGTSIYIYGYGPEEEQLKQLISSVGADNVILAGELPDKRSLHDAYRDADLFVLPCVEAANGDLDGLPTVLLEAMAAGTPVLSTKIANIPDLIIDGVTGFLAEPNNTDSLIDAVERFRNFPAPRLTQLLDDASKTARSYASIDKTASTLIDCWSRREIDIFLVTYDTEKYANIEDTIEIIHRIYKYTSMKFNLIVVDNCSRQEFNMAIQGAFIDKINFTFLALPENTMCGPASNIALNFGSAEYAIYLCSKEAFILQHGWERTIVRRMDANPNAAMGGHLINLSKYSTGLEIQNHPSFGKWRNKDFARSNSATPIFHIQGGGYILRRSAFLEAGGFNERVPQDGMDVEYSYYLTSMGYELLPIQELAIISNKTLPKIESLVDENTLVVHPSSYDTIQKLDQIVHSDIKHCVCCGWQGTSFKAEFTDREICPSCNTDGFARSVWRTLSQSGRLQSRPSVTLITQNNDFKDIFRQICRHVEQIEPTAQLADQLSAIRAKTEVPDMLVVDHCSWNKNTIEEFVSLSELIPCLIIGSAIDDEKSLSTLSALLTQIDIQPIKYISRSGGFDWRRIGMLTQTTSATTEIDDSNA